MNKPLISRSYIKLTLLVLIIVVAYLLVKSFSTGKKEGAAMQVQQGAN